MPIAGAPRPPTLQRDTSRHDRIRRRPDERRRSRRRGSGDGRRGRRGGANARGTARRVVLPPRDEVVRRHAGADRRDDERRARRDRRAPRGERRREVDADQDPRRHPRAGRGRCRHRPRALPAHARQRARAPAGRVHPPGPRPDRVDEHQREHRDGRRLRAPRPVHRPARRRAGDAGGTRQGRLRLPAVEAPTPATRSGSTSSTARRTTARATTSAWRGSTPPMAASPSTRRRRTR